MIINIAINTKYSIQHYWFIYKQSNGSKYCYVSNQPIGLMGRVFANGPGDQGSIPGWVIPKTQKMALDTS